MSSKPLVVLICVFACVVGSWSAEKKASLYNRAVESSVEMLVDGRIAGTGVIVDGNGTILTACHVIRTGERYEARSASFEQTPIKLICTDRSHDLALLSLPPRDKPYPFMELAKKIPAEGRQVHLLGTPIFRHRLLLTGFVARREPLFEWYDGAFMEGYPLTGIAAGGTSGGAWFNPQGEIVGVQAAAMTVGGAPQGVVTSSPLKAIRSLCKRRETVVVATMQAAVEELWGQDTGFIAKAPKKERALVFRQVDRKGVAGIAGINDGDLLLKMDRRSYDTVTSFLRTLRARKPGDKISLFVSNSKGENRREVVLELAELR